MIPETRTELWQAIRAEHGVLWEAVRNKSGEKAHAAEEKLQAYLQALPGKIADLEEGVRKRIEGQSRNLARAYAAVHNAADTKEWNKAEAEIKKADGGIRLLSALIPD